MGVNHADPLHKEPLLREPLTSETVKDAYTDSSSVITSSPDPLAETDSDVEIVHFTLPILSAPSKRKSISSANSPAHNKKTRRVSPTRWTVAGRPQCFTIKGQTLRPTEVFDTFWHFSAERKAIDDRRRAGEKFPWSDDPIFNTYRFCNTYRVLDKGTQFLIREVIEKGSQEPEELVFRVLLFNTFTKIETWKLLDEKLGPLTWATYNRKGYCEVLAEAKSRGKSLYTGSFIKPAPHFGCPDNYMNHLYLLEHFMEQDLVGRLSNAEYLADVYEFIISFPSMGDFTTYQLMLNLSYTNILNFHRNDFVVPGPGARSGLRKMFGKSFDKAKSSVRGFEVDAIRWLVETQNEHFKRLGIQFSGLGPHKLPMDVADVEHTLCEVDKYSRLAHPQFKGKRTEMRRRYERSLSPYPTWPCLPKAWSHPDRKISRIKPGGLPVVEKRYTINRIGGKREGEGGIEYLVYWTGYVDEDATWEPEELLLEDAPAVVAEYEKQWN